MAPQTYEQDESGNIIDPPILREHEQRIADAQATGDDALVHRLTLAYHEARADIAGELADADREDDIGPDLGGDLNDRDSLVQNNSYDDLRNAARARDLPTGGGKVDLAARIADHSGGGETT